MTDLVIKAQGREWRLEAARTYTLGRKQGVDLLVTGGVVSSRHATIAFADGSWGLTDLGSTNGTYVDGQRVSTVALTPGLAVMVGGAEDGVRLDVEEPASAERAPVPPPTRQQRWHRRRLRLRARRDRCRVRRDGRIKAWRSGSSPPVPLLPSRSHWC